MEKTLTLTSYGSHMFGIFKKIFGTAQGRLIKKYSKLVRKINVAEEALQSLSNEQVKAKTQEFKDRLAKGETLDDLLSKPMRSSKTSAAACGNRCPCLGL